MNIARGEHTPLSDLVRILEENRLGGVGLDVFEDEGILGASLRGSKPEENEMTRTVRHLSARPNVILTPHNAFNTIEAVKRKSQMSVEQVKHFLLHKDFIWKLE